MSLKVLMGSWPCTGGCIANVGVVDSDMVM